jgi:hypothetical protein
VALADDLLATLLERKDALLTQVRGLIERRQFAEASRLLGGAYKSLFGIDRRFLQMMRPREAAGLFLERRKVVAFAEMMAEEATLLRAQGDGESASATGQWTLRILEAKRMREEDERAVFARLKKAAGLLGP